MTDTDDLTALLAKASARRPSDDDEMRRGMLRVLGQVFAMCLRLSDKQTKKWLRETAESVLKS
jgi:hypothetical protein